VSFNSSTISPAATVCALIHATVFMMTNQSERPTLDAIARQLADSVPGNLKSIGEDVERNFKSITQSALSKMDLVTREEFDVQTAVLARTREKLESLEARLAELEADPSN
jgi:BMFP domain-containing protein YqiC